MLLRGDSADADALGPDVDPAVAIKLMNQISKTLLVLVGHERHLHRLATALGVGPREGAFRPAGGLVLENSAGAWSHIDTNDRSDVVVDGGAAAAAAAAAAMLGAWNPASERSDGSATRCEPSDVLSCENLYCV